MTDFFYNLISDPFSRALIAGLFVGVTCSLLSSFVILKKMAFIGNGISHAAFGGVALGLLLNINISMTASIFAVGASIMIWLVSRNKKVSEDSAIGIVMVASMALGILLLKEDDLHEISHYLFGNINSVGLQDVWIIAITGISVITLVILFFKELLYFTFDPDAASVSGLNIDFYHLFLLILLSATIVISIKLVGAILVSAYLIISGSTASLLTKSLKKMIIISIIVGVTSSFIGLFVSHSFKLSSGAVIILTMIIIFLLALFTNRFKKKIVRLKR